MTECIEEALKFMDKNDIQFYGSMIEKLVKLKLLKKVKTKLRANVLNIEPGQLLIEFSAVGYSPKVFYPRRFAYVCGIDEEGKVLLILGKDYIIAETSLQFEKDWYMHINQEHLAKLLAKQ